MKKFLVLFAFSLLFLGCAQYSSGAPNDISNPGNNATLSKVEVAISGFEFTPAAITIPAGTNVRWTNNDAAPHTITPDSSNLFGSGTIGQNGIYEYKFDIPGTYTYHCAIHTTMKGAVIVQ